MMTNVERALQVLEEARRLGEVRIDPHDAVEAIVQAGLLAPDLPEPAQSFSDGTRGWFVEDDEGRDIGSIYIFNGEILLRTAAGRVKGAPAKMRKIALALLAATNHAEENQ
ncbi:hypothetical protein HMPREF1261_02237 [Corynebacterium sp. KPL1818]|uniref:hypothetical protein n=1 Tax=Corynebacterium sp. KPL1818 TaxID=1203559 RepID=UPI0003B85DE1|nr:hypothetical protein [Corynebacterium sp. KPL1818]ERS58178.1 hypothetical protein HMPREF1261_02237 [Corynebacterium sp. KPL1818]